MRLPDSERARIAPPAEWPEALFNRFTLTIPPDAVADCSGSGDAGPAAAFHVGRPGIVWPAAALIREELAEYGAWSRAELAAMRAPALREILIWLAACDIRERAAQRD